MCLTPFEVAALAATAGGTYLQHKSQQDAYDDQQKAAEAEAMRQGQMDEEKFENFQQALAEIGRGDQQQNLDEATAEAEESYARNVSNPSEGSYSSPASSGAPRVVEQYEGDRQQEADDFVSLLGNARARQNAWGENMFQFGENMVDRNFDLGQLQTNMNRSAQIGQQEIQMAGRPGSDAMIGNALTGLGTAGIGIAGGKEGAFGGLFDTKLLGGGGNTVKNIGKNATAGNAVSYPIDNSYTKYKGTPIL